MVSLFLNLEELYTVWLDICVHVQASLPPKLESASRREWGRFYMPHIALKLICVDSICWVNMGNDTGKTVDFSKWLVSYSNVSKYVLQLVVC